MSDTATDHQRPTDATGAAPGTPLADPPATARVAGPRSSPTAVVAAEELTRCFDDEEVIHPLDLDIEPGTILGLIGPSGCGKTTTVRLLTGLLAPTTGRARVFGRDTVKLSNSERSRLGYLPQTPALFPDLSLDENLSFHASMYGLPFRRRKRLDQLLEWVELDQHRSKRVANASGGMQRRLALAAAFVHDPEVVFLDEPTAGIDPILRDKLWARFHAAADNGKTLIVTTQYVGEAGQCDQVGLLSDGELLLLDTPANLRRAAFEGEVVDARLAAPLTDADLARLSERDFVVGDVERSGPTGVRIVVEDADRALTDVESALHSLGAEVVEIDEHIVDYDEAFVRVVERHRTSTRGPVEDESDEVDAPGDDDPTDAAAHDGEEGDR